MKVEVKAFCSGSCASAAKTLNASSFVIKDVPKGKCDCPDCGYALVWKKENTRKFNYVDKRKTSASSMNKEYFR